MTSQATAAERAERGRAARSAVPRSSHGPYEPARGRPDPIGILEAQAATRVPELVPIRYGRMLSSPFAFYRGAAAIMASDLAPTPRSGFDVQCCGDAHLRTSASSPRPSGASSSTSTTSTRRSRALGVGPQAPGRRASRSRGANAGFATRPANAACSSTAGAYRALMAQLRGGSQHRRLVRAGRRRGPRPAVAGEVRCAKTRKRAGKVVAKARTRDSMDALAKLTRIVDGEPRIVSKPPLHRPARRTRRGASATRRCATLRGLMRGYRTHAAGQPARAPRQLRAGRLRAQGRRRRQRRHAGLDRRCCSAATTAIRSSCRSRRRRHRCTRPSSARARYRTPASASSRDSA